MAIKVEGVTKLYGKQKVLNNVSFGVQKGQVVGFLGPNGAGKSTMMKIITGFIQPTSGNVTINGTPINSASKDSRFDIGYMPENNPLYHDMYVKEYLQFVAKIYKLGRYSNKRVKGLIELTGIVNEQNKKIGELSKGYRQRVGLAQALLNRPSVLILDEPTSGLDPNQIIEIRKIIADVGREKTVLLSTHIMQEVEAICSNVIILNKGEIVANGPTTSIMLDSSVKQQTVTVEIVEPITPGMLMGIEGVSNVEQSNINKNTWTVKSMAEKDIRPDIFNFCLKNNLTIITLFKKTMQMEDVFQTVTHSPNS
ncbi:MAG: ATP-binding cassette domain-containing protein [Tenuifilaceae bacterium]|nr:ATP-binding cassette domain-containing protein [Tenuifilaceae bacterium]